MRNGGEAENAVQGTVQRGNRFEELLKEVLSTIPSNSYNKSIYFHLYI